jgi:hypothetical protein
VVDARKIPHSARNTALFGMPTGMDPRQIRISHDRMYP